MSTGKDNRATSGGVAIASERAAARLMLLVQELQDELGGRYGSQAKIARQLGIDQPLVSKLMSRERTSVGLATVENARVKMGLRHEFFFGPAEPRTYRDYTGGDEDAPYPAWKDFVLTDVGKSMTEDERVALASFRFPNGDATVAFYTIVLMVMRSELSSEKRAAALAESMKLQKENDEDDRD